jgi:phosphatidylglycerophosphate synthase
MFRHIPNALTASRLLLALVFFTLLALYQYEGRGDPWLLNIAFLIYVAALVTDFLDGYLARKWKVEGAFGRIVDPFVDKILVLGTFIFFAGKNFIIPETAIAGAANDANVVRTITGVAPGVVVILLARELLVTSLRGEAESAGQAFGAAFAGKVKMGFQSATILGILVYVNYHAWTWPSPYDQIAFYVREFGIWGTVLITLYSSIQYIQNASALYRRGVART